MLGVGLGLTSRMGIGGVAAGSFNPATLSPTAWYDPSDSTTVFADLAGTTQANNGDLVRRIDDKSGNGNHLLALSDATRSTRVQDGALWYLDFLSSAMADTFAAPIPQPTFMSMAVKLDTVAMAQTLFDNNNAASGDRQNIHHDAGNWNLFATVAATPIGAASTAPAVVSGNYNGAGSVGYVNGVASAAVNPGAAGAEGIRIGISNGGVNPFDGRVYGLIFLPRTPTAQERNDIHAYLAGKAGVTL